MLASCEQPLVSVVTPVYNGAAYLDECLHSVAAQTYPCWEHVIVDNCSTDATPAIAERQARADGRVRVAGNREFLPQFRNWNHALRQIAPAARYVKVVHADDWLFPECLERMVAVAEAHPTVGVVSAYRLEQDRVSLDGLEYPSECVPGQIIGRRYLLEHLNVFGSPTSVLLRADLVRAAEAFYDEAILHSDTEACLRLVRDCDFGFVHQVLTFTRRHNESLTSATQRLGTEPMLRLQLLVRHGPAFLAEAEYRRQLALALDHHYRFLARSLFDLREGEFWRFQCQALSQLSYPIQWPRLAGAAAAELLDIHRTARRLRKGLSARATRGRQRSRPTAAQVLGTIRTADLPAPATAESQQAENSRA